MHCCSRHLFSTCHPKRRKWTYTRANTPAQWCSNLFAMQTSVSHLATCALPKKPTDSTLSHGSVAAVLSHKHHLIIHICAGLIQFVYCLHCLVLLNQHEGIVTVPGFLRERAKGHEPTIENHQRNSSKSPCPPLDNQSGGGSLPSTLTTSLAIPIPSSSSSNGPSH